MIKRTLKQNVKNLLADNTHWNIVDIGGGSRAWPEANTILDIKDHSGLYEGKRFVQSDACKTPFNDKEFDFVIASHITEHIQDIELFISELTRIGKRGYIEVPTPLFDNLTFGNLTEHKWWLYFDDDKNELLYTEKKVKIKQVWYPEQLERLDPYFFDMMQMSFIWEDSIEYNKLDQENKTEPIIKLYSTKIAARKASARNESSIFFQNDGSGSLRRLD
jgi:ubiquinone/menaquinone biosynthesis C-methylase UbiE